MLMISLYCIACSDSQNCMHDDEAYSKNMMTVISYLFDLYCYSDILAVGAFFTKNLMVTIDCKLYRNVHELEVFFSHNSFCEMSPRI